MSAGTDGTVLRWMPPLVVSAAEIDEALAAFAAALKATPDVMARLDASRVAAWRELQSVAAELERTIDEELMAEWDVPLGWFDVLAGLQRLGGTARPSELAAELRLVRSSLSRRLDRLEEEGWVARRRPATPTTIGPSSSS